MMSQIIACLITAMICVGAHMIFFYLQRRPLQFESPVRKLLYQGKVVLAIWVLFAPLVVVFQNMFEPTGMDRVIYQGMTGRYASLVFATAFFFYLFFLYLTAYYMVDRSVSSRIMIEIETSPDGTIAFDRLSQAYDVDAKYRDQLNGMLQGGFVVREQDTYKCTMKGLFVARIAYFFKTVLRLGAGG